MEGLLLVVWVFALAAAPAWFFLRMAIHLLALSGQSRSRKDHLVTHLVPFAFLDPNRYTPQGVKELEQFKRSFVLFVLSSLVVVLVSMIAESLGWPAQQAVAVEVSAARGLSF